jgi:hypothetical protein
VKLDPDLERRILQLAAEQGVGGTVPAPVQESEKEFQARVIGEAKRNGWDLIHHHYDSRKSSPGWLDLALGRTADGRFLVAELKIPPNTPTPAQQAWLSLLRAAGVEVHLWRPEDWPSIVKVLK